MMRRNSSGNGAGGCSSDEMTVDQQINFDSDLPLHSVVIGGEIVVNPDPPPPYSLPTENLASNQQRVIGEPPPPYAAAITNVNLIQHRTNQGTDGLANGNFSDSDTSSSSGLDDDYFTPSMSESDTEPVQCDCPNCCLSSAQRATQAATCWNSPSSLQCGNEPNCRGEETPHPSGIVSTQLRYNGESSSVPVTEILPSLCPDCHHRVNQQLSNDSAVARFHASRDKRLGEDSGGIDHSKILQHKKMSRAVRRKVKKVLRKNPRPTHTSSTTAAVDRVSVTSNLAEHNTVAVSNASES